MVRMMARTPVQLATLDASARERVKVRCDDDMVDRLKAERHPRQATSTSLLITGFFAALRSALLGAANGIWARKQQSQTRARRAQKLRLYANRGLHKRGQTRPLTRGPAGLRGTNLWAPGGCLFHPLPASSPAPLFCEHCYRRFQNLKMTAARPTSTDGAFTDVSPAKGRAGGGTAG